MKLEEIIINLNSENINIVTNTIRQARQNKQEVCDRIIQELETISKKMDNNELEYAPEFVFNAFLVLAEFKDKRLINMLKKIVARPNLDSFNFFGYAMMEYIPSLVISVFTNEFEAINSVIENIDVDDYTKGFYLDTYICLYKNNIITQKALEDYLKKIIDIYCKIIDEKDIYSSMLDSVFGVIEETKLVSMLKYTIKLYDNGYIDPYMYGDYWKYVNYVFDEKCDAPRRKPITDSIQFINGFNEPKSIKNNITKTINNKVGRNDLCPCGSGKKYKKCCLNKIEITDHYERYLNNVLKDYPTNELFYQSYNDEIIELDKLLYHPLKNIKSSDNEENTFKKQDLEKGFLIIKDLINKYDIKTTDDYNDKIAIHNGIHDFISVYTQQLRSNTDELSKFKDLVDTINKLHNSNKSRTTILYANYNYYKITKQYDEAIKYFENKLDTNEYYIEDICLDLFDLYKKAYGKETARQKANDIINKYNEPSLKEIMEDIIEDED